MSDTVLAGTARGRTLPAAATAGHVALAIVAAAAWAVLAIGLAGHATHDEVLGHGHVPHPATVAALIGGWLLMVAAIMLPPELVTGGRRGAPPGAATDVPPGTTTLAATAALAAATFAVWTAFAIVALSGDAVVHALADSRPWLERSVAPALLIGAGLFQLSPGKGRLLAAARRPAGRPWRHAVRCLGGCWALMLVMFAVGLGNLIWMIVLTVVMTAERAERGRLIRVLAGLGLIVAGVLVAVQPHP
jgi:predicted metal-binding membrane protein